MRLNRKEAKVAGNWDDLTKVTEHLEELRPRVAMEVIDEPKTGPVLCSLKRLNPKN